MSKFQLLAELLARANARQIVDSSRFVLPNRAYQYLGSYSSSQELSITAH